MWCQGQCLPTVSAAAKRPDESKCDVNGNACSPFRRQLAGGRLLSRRDCMHCPMTQSSPNFITASRRAQPLLTVSVGGRRSTAAGYFDGLQFAEVSDYVHWQFHKPNEPAAGRTMFWPADPIPPGLARDWISPWDWPRDWISSDNPSLGWVCKF